MHTTDKNQIRTIPYDTYRSVFDDIIERDLILEFVKVLLLYLRKSTYMSGRINDGLGCGLGCDIIEEY